MHRWNRPGAGGRRLHQHTWMHGLPLKARFRRSKLYISALLPIGIGFVIGVFRAIFGIGGGFFIGSGMCFMLGIATSGVSRTSVLQILFFAAYITVLQASTKPTLAAVPDLLPL